MISMIKMILFDYSEETFRLEKRVAMAKGLELPTNLIVVVGIAVVAVAAIGAFLLSGSLSNISTAEAQRIFSNGCTKYCSSTLYGTLQNAFQASVNDKDFVSACTRLGYFDGSQVLMEKCMEKCGNCNLDTRRTDTAGGIDSLVAKTTRG